MNRKALEGCVFLSPAVPTETTGPTDAAGGMAHARRSRHGTTEGTLPLRSTWNEATPTTFLKECDGLLITGPTNTNVCDIQVLLVG